ncbi:hypothetical protein MMC21_007327 [Puttea exsequens]|nr:hypothetical protein [Puttea exsequens]
MPNKSPEKSLIKSQHHKRLQSFQNGGGSTRNSYIEALGPYDKSLEKSLERLPRTPGFENENCSPERSPTRSDLSRSGTPTPSGREPGRENMRSSRPPPRPILGENTPPSSTMLALQNMATPKNDDGSLQNLTNASNLSIRSSQNFDAISTQILSLTNIATNLQREMAQLSRRSKDNATDLMGLKATTESRDQDIRNDLKKLVTRFSSQVLEPQAINGSRGPSSYSQRPAGLYLENNPHISPPNMSKSFSLPRIPSPNSALAASIDREISASPYNADGAGAIIALCDTIVRDMASKEGQEKAFSILADLQDRSKCKDSDPVVVKKLEDILSALKTDNVSKALVPRRDNGNGIGNQQSKAERDFSSPPRSMARRNITPQLAAAIAHSPPKPADLIVSEDMHKLLKKMKDSITEGGGMTAEVKAHVRELRGEVLGMGRDIARKLDQAESTTIASRGNAQGPGREEIAQIVQDGLADLQHHMDAVMREKRRESGSSVASRRSVDSQEVYTAVKNALTEFPLQQQVALQNSGSSMEREEILDAVREAWETYKPEIELQNFGLEREEILQCLKEGLREYQPQDRSRELSGASYEEVLDAVREGLQDFKPPQIETEASLTQEEILTTVRECLETFDFPSSNMGAVGVSREPEMTREDVLDAVREGLSTQPFTSQLAVNRDDLFEAVKAGLDGSQTPMGGVGEAVLDKMQELIDGMRSEFKQYSAANGGDTEQVLDHMTDGLEDLRKNIEQYVDRAADVTGKDEILEAVKVGLENLRVDLEGSIINAPKSTEYSNNNGELLDAMEKEFEHLGQTITASMVRSGESGPDREEILDTIREGLGVVSNSVSRDINPDASGDTIAVMREEFEHLRETLATTLMRTGGVADKEDLLEAIREEHETLRAQLDFKHDRPDSILSGTGELLDALNEGLESLRVDMERMVNKPTDMTVNDEILQTLREGLAELKKDFDRLHAAQSGQHGFSGQRDGEVVVAEEDAPGIHLNEISHLKMMITQLTIKVEALDNMPPPTAAHPIGGSVVAEENIEGLASMLREVQASLADINGRERTRTENSISKEDTEAIETLLRNTKAVVEGIALDDEGIVKVRHIDSLEAVLNETRDEIQDFSADRASKKDFGVLEALLKEVRIGLEELRGTSPNDEPDEKVRKTDIEALETLCVDMKTQIDELELPDPQTLPTRTEIENLEMLMKDLNQSLTQHDDMNGQGLKARKDEHQGLFNGIDEMKLILEDVRGELKTKVGESHQCVEDLAQTLECVGETVTAADATASISELLETVRREFESLHKASATVKEMEEQNHALVLEKHDQHKAGVVNELNAKIDERFDEIMTKYDDAQLAAQEKERKGHSKGFDQAETLKATKAAAEDLRLLADALGSTVTDSCDRISEDSKTVFNRVDEVALKLDNMVTADRKAEHQATRAEISQTLAAVEAVQAHATEYNSKIYDAVEKVLAIVAQHFDQSRASAEEIKANVNAIPGAIPLPAITPSTRSPELLGEAPALERYDDKEIHVKLDRLVAHATDVEKPMVSVDVLEQIKEQVGATASRVEAFVAAQTAAASEAGLSRVREGEEVAIAIEKRTAQKDIVEADIVRLSEQKAGLGSEVEELQKEKHELVVLKSKMQADLSSLETALQIRREELHIMEVRADGLERRILDGVLDHSRSLLTTSRPQSSLKEMNLKRVASTASNVTATTRASTVATTIPSTGKSAVSSGVGMALKRRQPPRTSGPSTNAVRPDRRILSLSTLGANKDSSTERSMVLANPSVTGGNRGAGGIKRSHSVKSNFPSRKTSWNGTKALGMYADEGIDEGDDKENSVLTEEDEEVNGSDAGTERRTSYSGTYSGTGSYGEGSVVSGDDKRTSYAPSTIGTVGVTEEEEAESEDERSHDGVGDDDGKGLYLGMETYHGDQAAIKGAISNAGEMAIFGQPSDSGIGTDIPTAQLEGGSDYFKV